MDTFTVEFERTLDDYVEFNLYHLAHSPSSMREFFLQRLLAALAIAILVFALLLLAYEKLTVAAFLSGALGGMVAFFGAPRLYRAYLARRVRQLYAEGDNAATLGHQSLSLSSEGITAKTRAGDSRLYWSSVKKVVQNEYYLFMYIGATNAIVVPKRSFASEKSAADFVDFVISSTGHKSGSGAATPS